MSSFLSGMAKRFVLVVQQKVPSVPPFCSVASVRTFAFAELRPPSATGFASTEGRSRESGGYELIKIGRAESVVKG
jgi:hypothetical protein